MRRLCLLLMAWSMAFAYGKAGCIKDCVAEIAALDGVGLTDVTDQVRRDGSKIERCELMIVGRSALETVRSIVTGLPTSLVLSDLEDGGDKVKVWMETCGSEYTEEMDNRKENLAAASDSPVDSKKADLLMFAESEGEYLVIYLRALNADALTQSINITTSWDASKSPAATTPSE